MHLVKLSNPFTSAIIPIVLPIQGIAMRRQCKAAAKRWNVDKALGDND